jgi:putative ABC transport system ATP-binding protein
MNRRGGTVRLNGEDYRKLAPQELRRRVSMVMQTAYLFPGTVAENLAYGPRQRGQRLLAEQTNALLQRVGLSGYQERNASNLSGGEAQRVSIARTLANAPERSSSWMSQPQRSMKTQHEESKISCWISFVNGG